jgi:DNA-binding GntR family transcriptional regulator
MQLELSERIYATEVPRRFVREHEEIVDALASGDGERAAEAMARHLAHSREVLEKSLRGGADATEKGEK